MNLNPLAIAALVMVGLQSVLQALEASVHRTTNE
jgi:hypothetical protein